MLVVTKAKICGLPAVLVFPLDCIAKYIPSQIEHLQLWQERTDNGIGTCELVLTQVDDAQVPCKEASTCFHFLALQSVVRNDEDLRELEPGLQSRCPKHQRYELA